MVEHSLGKGEVESSILSCSTSQNPSSRLRFENNLGPLVVVAAPGLATAGPRSQAGQLAVAHCAASVASRDPIASRRSSCAFAAMSSIEGEFASSDRARLTISLLLGM